MFLGENNGVPSAKKLNETKRIDLIETEFQWNQPLSHSEMC